MVVLVVGERKWRLNACIGTGPALHSIGNSRLAVTVLARGYHNHPVVWSQAQARRRRLPFLFMSQSHISSRLGYVQQHQLHVRLSCILVFPPVHLHTFTCDPGF